MNNQSLHTYKKLIKQQKSAVIVKRVLQHQNAYSVELYKEWVRQQKLAVHNQD